MEPIADRLNLLSQANNLQGNDTEEQTPIDNFADILSDNLQEVNQLEQEAEDITQQFALGEIDDIHKVTVATEKARLALQLTTEIQNQITQAYDDIMRMQI